MPLRPKQGNIMDRRKFIAGAGGVILTSRSPAVFGKSELVYPSDACHPTIRQTQGPYLTPDSPRRSDIREGAAGVPIKLELTVVDDLWCKPVSDFVVDIWHCDANGLYSGVDNIAFDRNTLEITDQAVNMKDKSFLRGHQVTDENGKVVFTTIYPGWYMPRIAHIHVRLIWRDVEWTAFDTQLYLPADIERTVYETAPYAARGPNPIGVDRDILIKGDSASVDELTIALDQDGDGYKGSFEIAATSL